MTTMLTDGISVRIAERLRERRLALGLSHAELAGTSGVSKAMIGKIEAGISSPTAGLLGRLCAGLGVSMSALMAAVETEDAVLLAAADQPTWRDQETGLERTAVSPGSPVSAVEVARLRLPAGAVVSYPTPPRIAFGQQLVGLAGTVRFTVGERAFDLGPGDCVAARIDRPTRFEVLGQTPAVYLAVIDRTGR